MKLDLELDGQAIVAHIELDRDEDLESYSVSFDPDLDWKNGAARQSNGGLHALQTLETVLCGMTALCAAQSSRSCA